MTADCIVQSGAHRNVAHPLVELGPSGYRTSIDLSDKIQRLEPCNTAGPMRQRVRTDRQIFMQEESGKRFVDPLERGHHCSADYNECENGKDNEQLSPVPSLVAHVVLP